MGGENVGGPGPRTARLAAPCWQRPDTRRPLLAPSKRTYAARPCTPLLGAGAAHGQRWQLKRAALKGVWRRALPSAGAVWRWHARRSQLKQPRRLATRSLGAARSHGAFPALKALDPASLLRRPTVRTDAKCPAAKHGHSAALTCAALAAKAQRAAAQTCGAALKGFGRRGLSAPPAHTALFPLSRPSTPPPSYAARPCTPLTRRVCYGGARAPRATDTPRGKTSLGRARNGRPLQGAAAPEAGGRQNGIVLPGQPRACAFRAALAAPIPPPAAPPRRARAWPPAPGARRAAS
jgi:hypothetical protein